VGVVPSTEKVGNVSVGRYEQIVERLREAAEKLSKSSFVIGDGALEVAHRLSEDIDVPYNTIKEYR
jgi:hypothetical protein